MSTAVRITQRRSLLPPTRKARAPRLSETRQESPLAARRSPGAALVHRGRGIYPTQGSSLRPLKPPLARSTAPFAFQKKENAGGFEVRRNQLGMNSAPPPPFKARCRPPTATGGDPGGLAPKYLRLECEFL